jgi:hypothetical protein
MTDRGSRIADWAWTAKAAPLRERQLEGTQSAIRNPQSEQRNPNNAIRIAG